MKTKLLLLLFLANFSINAQTNLVPNGGFESWTGFTLQDWTVANSVTQSTDFTEGQSSAKLTNTGLSPKIIALIPLKAGITYTIKYKYKYLSNNYGGDHPISLKISQNGSSASISSSAFASNNNWTEKETTFTPDSDLSYELSISTFNFDSATFEVLIDDVSVVDPNETAIQYTLIPDPKFEQALINYGYDLGVIDGKVPTANISGIKELNVSFYSISNLTGIEDFAALETLTCPYNNLNSINISNNLNLKALYCNENKLYTLDVSKNTALSTLDCSKNNIYIMDVSSNPELLSLNCSSNYNIQKLDVSNNLKLKTLKLDGTGVHILSVANNSELTTFSSVGTTIVDLDFSKNTKLTSVDCSNNYFLTLVNLKNGNNKNLDLTTSNFTGNNFLYCIQVDDADYSNNNWGSLKADGVAFYKNSCADEPHTLIPDVNFEKTLISFGSDYREVDGKVLTANIVNFSRIILDNRNISDLTGIQDFVNLDELSIKSNNLTTVDLSKNVNLTKLNASLNPNLTCIKVADVAYSQANWTTIKDAQTNFSTTCTLGLENSVFAKATVYPNPTHGEVNINNIALEKATVYNSLGQLVKTFNLNSDNTNNTINLSGLPKGIYYVYLINQDAASAKKVILE